MEQRADSSVVEEQAEQALRVTLQEIGATQSPLPPPDLVARALQRLPDSSPPAYARRLRRRRQLTMLFTGLAAAFAALIALIGAWSVLGQERQIAQLGGRDLALTTRPALAGAVHIFRPNLPGALAGEETARALLSGIGAIGITLVSLLWVNFWPARTATTALVLTRRPWRALGVGMLCSIALGGMLLPALTFAATTLPGLVLALPVLAMLHVPYIYGMTTLARALGARIAGRDTPPPQPGAPMVAAVIAIVLPIALVAAVAPLWGLLLGYALASIGVGAAVISRAGTRL
jgi:hypothetical protein